MVTLMCVRNTTQLLCTLGVCLYTISYVNSLIILRISGDRFMECFMEQVAEIILNGSSILIKTRQTSSYIQIEICKYAITKVKA